MGHNSGQEEFYKELLRDFKIESAEHYQTILEGIYNLPLDSDLSGSPQLEHIYRSTHSLKGAARAINLKEIEKVCSSLESVFGQIKKESLQIDKTLKEGFKSHLELLKELLDNIESDKKPPQSLIDRNIRNIQFLLSQAKPVLKDSKNSQDESSKKKGAATEQNKMFENHSLESGSIRIENDHLIKIIQQSENFITLKNSISHIREEVQEIYSRQKDHKTFHILEEITKLESDTGKMTDELTANINRTLLSTFESIVRLLLIMTQEIAQEYGKEIEFKAKGSHIKIDRRILTEIKDTLIHILRNSIDHGIETPDERISKGKERKGIISFNVEKLMDGKVKITISDDGRGIDKESLISSALDNKIYTKEECSSLSSSQIDNLIFKSGISSKKHVTDISGRGLGMSIVAEKIAELGGSVTTHSEKDKGTTFSIILPQSITTFKGLLVQAGKYEVMIPYKHIEKVSRIEKKEINTIGNKPHIKDSSGTNIGITKLSNIISNSDKDLTQNYNQSGYETLILSGKKGKFAYIVDKVYRIYEGILRKAEKPFDAVKNITGFTIIKNGIIIPVLDINEVTADTAVKEETWSTKKLPQKESVQKVLIAEDSITIRAMLRNFVESEGFKVTTASDGRDALDLISRETFDIIVSDIEMPNMNGFDLTREIKSNSSTQDIPVILVSALESDEDKKRGMDAGADAYIIKSSFENSTLMETIRQLI